MRVRLISPCLLFKYYSCRRRRERVFRGLCYIIQHLRVRSEPSQGAHRNVHPQAEVFRPSRAVAVRVDQFFAFMAQQSVD